MRERGGGGQLIVVSTEYISIQLVKDRQPLHTQLFHKRPMKLKKIPFFSGTKTIINLDQYIC